MSGVADLPLLLERLLLPPAITIVGASPNGHITSHLLHNLENRSCRFGGRVHLVNPAYARLFDRPCLRSPAEIEGEPGLVYLLVRPEACLPSLEALGERAHGVILFPDASHEPGGYEEAVSAWGRAHDVGVLGPQSNGLVSLPGRVHGLLIPVAERLAAGEVAILAQSGGVLGGLVKSLAQRRVGLHAALEYGTGCMLGLEELAMALLRRPEVRLLALYADGLASVDGFARVLETAERAGKAVVAMIAGLSDGARRAVASHSGMAVTPRRVLRGLASQHGALLVDTLDELVWSIEALHGVGYERPPGSEVAVFSDSGGGAIALADALASQGLGLVEPEGEARDRIGARFGTALNPFDFGSASMGHVREQAEDVRAVASEPRYGVFAFASTIGLATAEQSVHVAQIDEFTATVEGLGRFPLIASPVPLAADDPDPLQGRRALLGLGSLESAAKIRALACWARGGAASSAPPVPRPRRAPAAPGRASASVISGRPAQGLLRDLPVAWPSQTWLSTLADLDASPRIPFPVVVKTEAGLAHRARLGGVLPGIDSERDLRNAVRYLLDRFGGPISIAQLVPHDEEYFLGAYREAAMTLILLGAGGAQAEDADVRLAPLRPEQARAFAERHAPDRWKEVTELLLAFQDWLQGAPWVEAVDLNPVVPGAVGLVVLDAKIHGVPRSDPLHG